MDPEKRNNQPHSAPGAGETQSSAEHKEPNGKKPRRHMIANGWVRIPLKVLMWIVIAVLLIPVLVYIPPVQTLLKNVACDVVSKSTGMKMSIDRFRLKFPLDVALDGVVILDQKGDTMVRADEAVADVRLRPLLNLDLQLKRLQLIRGYYRMVSPDSSMIMAIRARHLEVDAGSAVNIATSEISLSRVRLEGGDLSLYMNVWKKKPTPVDSTAKSTPFLIRARELDLKDFRFAMSMLPTIDTLTLNTKSLALRDATVDLRASRIHARSLAVADGGFTYLTPTAEYIKTHPAPPPEPSTDPPMRIGADSISLAGFTALYGVKGARPQPGFDPSYLKFSGVNIAMHEFYNESSTVRLPIERLEATERSGLKILRGSGFVGIDSLGINIRGLDLTTLYSDLHANADLTFAMMAMQPDGKVSASLRGTVGIPDITAFMPSLRTYTRLLPTQRPISLDIAAAGSLKDLDVPRLVLNVPQCVALKASARVRNPLKPKQLGFDATFDGDLLAPNVITKVAGPLPVVLPRLAIKGKASGADNAYQADFALSTPEGKLAAKGSLSLDAESYDVDLAVNGMNVMQFMPSLGVGPVTASLTAQGAGFNPMKPGMRTEVSLDVASLQYLGRQYRDITLEARLKENYYELYADSRNTGLDLSIRGFGRITGSTYEVNLDAVANDVDLRAAGITPDVCGGHGRLSLTGTAAPDKWLYDLKLDVANLFWDLGKNYISLPGGAGATLHAGVDSTALKVSAPLTSLDFAASDGLKQLIDRFGSVTGIAGRQIAERRVDVDRLREAMPEFTLDFAASGRGLLSQFLENSSISVDSVWGSLSNRGGIGGDVSVRSLNTGSMLLDTITLGIAERGQLLDYRLHVGNRQQNLPEFANVNVLGYIGGNRASISVNQKNAKGETGYRLGLTAAMQDSTVSVHFTPLKATIAYLPWTINDDNHIDYSLNGEIDADLSASSSTSSIALQTVPRDDGHKAVHVALQNIRIQDFLQMSVFAPPITGSINSDMTVFYNGKALGGKGTIGIKDFAYNKQRVGSFDLEFGAGSNFAGRTGASASLLLDGRKVLTARGYMLADSTVQQNKFAVELHRFPLRIANPFLGADIAMLSGGLSGKLEMTGEFAAPVLNGKLACDSVGVTIPMMGSTLRLDGDSLTMTDNILSLTDFRIFGQNSNPIAVNGTVNARKFSEIGLDLSLAGTNFQLVNNDRRARSDIYGKLFLTLAASAKGQLDQLNINGNLSVLSASDVSYTIPQAVQQISQQTNADDIVRFVQFSDTTAIARKDTIRSSASMRINAQLTIQQGALVTVNLSNNGTDKVQLNPSGTLSYFQNYMGDMRLNGQLFLGEGFARYTVPVIGQKMFTFEPGCYVLWNGDILNPILNINAVDQIKASVKTGQNSRLVNFDVSLSVTNNLAAPKITFDLKTDDDMTINNELQSMSPDQRSNQAMNLLLYGQYTGPGSKTNQNSSLVGNPLFSLLESQINSWAAKNIRGIDLSFGIDQYDQTRDGRSSTATSYSYQMSKSLFNNRFKIVVGGNYSTDASADENLAQNLISDISFEYIFKQTNTLTLYGRIFRHRGFESILEGEVTQTGLGFVMKRRLSNLKSLFRFRRRHKKADSDSVATPDSILQIKESDSTK